MNGLGNWVCVLEGAGNERGKAGACEVGRVGGIGRRGSLGFGFLVLLPF